MLNPKVLTLRTLHKTSLFNPKTLTLEIWFFVTLILVLDKIVVYVDDKKIIDIEFDIEVILNLFGINICKPKKLHFGK